MKILQGSSSILFGLAMVAATPAIGGISFTCDASIMADGPVGLCAAINSTIDPLYLSTFSNANANIFIEFSNNGGLADSTSGFFNLVSYSTYQAALQAQSTDPAKLTVPGAEPGLFGNSGNVNITSALAEALGITTNVNGNPILGLTSGTNAADGSINSSSCTTFATPASGCYNGLIQLNIPADLKSEIVGGNPLDQGYTYRTLGGSTTGTTENYDVYSIIEHELDEILGTASCVDLGSGGTSIDCPGSSPSAVDLFRYSSSGVRAFASQTPGTQYFSPDGGVTDTDGATYNTTKPGEDWADFSQGCTFVQDAEGCPTSNNTGSFDITNDGLGGTAGPEVAILNAVGYNLQSTNAPEPASIGMFGFGLAALGGLAYRRRRQKSESL